MNVFKQPRNLRIVSSVAINTFKEAVRSKVFGSLIFFSLITSLSSLTLSEMSLHNEQRVLLDLGIFFSTLFATSIAIYSSITLFYTEFERRTIYTILSKPVHRWQFLFGKYIGVQFLMLGVVTFMSTTTLTLLISSGFQPNINLLAAFCTLYLQLCIVTALAHLFAVVSSPLLAGFASAGTYIAGNLFSQLEIIKKILTEQENPLAISITIIEYILPNLESLNLSRELTLNIETPSTYITQATTYTLTYTIIVLILASLTLEARDIT